MSKTHDISANLAGVDLNLLVTFDAIMAERNVTRAGVRVGRTQPAMSAALARLRDLFDDELFVRGPHGLEPTPRAMDLTGPIDRALVAATEAVGMSRVFDPATARGTFRLGLAEHPQHFLLAPLTTEMRRLAPEMSLDIRAIKDREDTIRLLDAGEIDAAVGVSVSGGPRFLHQKLFSETFVCILRADHPKFHGEMALEQFAKLGHILVSPENERFGSVDRHLAKHGLTRHLALTLPDMHRVPDLVARTDLVATIMRGVVQMSSQANQLVIFEPPVSMPTIDFHLHWHRRSDTHSGQTWLRKVVARLAGEAVAKQSDRQSD